MVLDFTVCSEANILGETAKKWNKSIKRQDQQQQLKKKRFAKNDWISVGDGNSK